MFALKGTYRKAIALGVLAVGVLLALFGLATAPAAPARAAGQTVVTFGFDDGYDDAYNARAILASHGMHATFYVNTGNIGTAGRMTWAQLQDLYADGNEIAGHTLDHVNLKKLKTFDLLHQICDDRVNLFNHGFQPTSFAYPFGSFDDTTKQAVAHCGYNSGRGVAGGPETIPPLDVYALRAFPSVKGKTTLATMEGWVTQTESAGGGWVIFVMHHVCDKCDVYSISPTTLSALLDWLQARAANGTVVKTNTEAVGGVVQPPVPAQ